MLPPNIRSNHTWLQVEALHGRIKDLEKKFAVAKKKIAAVQQEQTAASEAQAAELQAARAEANALQAALGEMQVAAAAAAELEVEVKSLRVSVAEAAEARTTAEQQVEALKQAHVEVGGRGSGPLTAASCLSSFCWGYALVCSAPQWQLERIYILLPVSVCAGDGWA